MSAIMITSSSPAQTFAPSPTQIHISSSPQPPSQQTGDTILRHTIYFKQSQTTRDSFSTGFSSAKAILGTRSSAENVPMGSRSPRKFMLSPPRSSLAKIAEPTQNAAIPQHADIKPMSDWDGVPPQGVVKVLPSDAKKKKRVDTVGPLQLPRATARKTSWTPPKKAIWDGRSEEPTAKFGINMDDFGYDKGAARFERTTSGGHGGLAKRRKIDLTSVVGKDAPVLNPPQKPQQRIITKPPPKPRNKSPVKKAKTITGLVTAPYVEGSKSAGKTLMMDHFVSTQANKDAEQDPATFETRVKTKGPLKNSKGQPRSALRSPSTALKTHESQEVVFASASQLARDESPTLIRETAEAIKQSMEHIPSSPLPTQQTAVFSIESTTPEKPGLSRFRSRRSLWTAPNRDEHDALLHMDDPFLGPEVRDAFAGEDAQVEHAGILPQLDGPSDSMALLTKLQPETTYDISEIDSPPPSGQRHSRIPHQARAYSTASRSPSSKRTKELSKSPHTYPQSPVASLISTPPQSPKKSPAKQKLSPKPNYAVWTDEQLKDKCTQLGIKRLRARKSRIDKLDEYWAEAHNIDSVKVKAATKAASQNAKNNSQPVDFLGNVHDLAKRPVPKTRKPRAKRKEVGDTTSKRAKKDAITEDGVDYDAFLAGKHDLAEEDPIHISDIDINTVSVFDRLADVKALPDPEDPNGNDTEENYESDAAAFLHFEPPASTAPVKGTGVKATAKKKLPAKKTKRPLTPPPTVPPKATQASSPAFDSPTRPSPKRKKRSTKATSPTRTSPIRSSQRTAQDTIDLNSLILPALLAPAPSDPTRNHRTHPTWHEKILMFDPIVLEDFTAWLNTEGLNSVGEDREIEIERVKEWCTENGVCCLWRGGWRGNKKAKKGEE